MKQAFTLSETLVVLAIIGVVAAISLPTVFANINERKNSERQVNIVYKVNRAMENMRAQGQLTNYPTTEEFVNVLQKYIKVLKVCYKDNLAECWPTEKIKNSLDEEVSVAEAKTSKNLGFRNRKNETNNVGMILSDGSSIILNYDNSFQGMDVGDIVKTFEINLPSGGQGSKVYLQYATNVMAPVAFVMDVNGKSGPNSETINNNYHDIRSFNGAGFLYVPKECYEDTCIYYFGNAYSPFNCRADNSGSEGYDEYCGEHPSGVSGDYWAGAQAKCASFGMKVPTVDELRVIHDNKFQFKSIASLYPTFWTSEERSDAQTQTPMGQFVTFQKHGYSGAEIFTLGSNYHAEKWYQYNVICISE